MATVTRMTTMKAMLMMLMTMKMMMMMMMMMMSLIMTTTAMQWAAVRTAEVVMAAPPQKCRYRLTRIM